MRTHVRFALSVFALAALAPALLMAQTPAPAGTPEPAPAESPAPAPNVSQDSAAAPQYGTVVGTPPAIPGEEVPYGMAWYGKAVESEWSPFDMPFGPWSYWDAYTWGFLRFRDWFDCQRLGGCWPPLWSAMGWGWDPWYGGWYGWLPGGIPAGYEPAPWFGQPLPPPRFQMASFRPAEVIAPKPPTRPSRVRGFHPSSEVSRAKPTPTPTKGSPGFGASGEGFRPSPSPAMRPPSSPPPSFNPPRRRR